MDDSRELYYVQKGRRHDAKIHDEWLKNDKLTPKQIRGYMQLAQKLGLSKQEAQSIYLTR